MPAAQVEGIQLTVMPFRRDAVIGTIALHALLQLVPSPKVEEDKRGIRYTSGAIRRHAEIRALVQRTLRSTQKGRNVADYAQYIAAGVNGKHGSGWSTPPITLWLAGEPGAVSEELVANSGVYRITLHSGFPIVAIDGETQVTALHELNDDPEAFGLTFEQLRTVRLPFELYWGLNVSEARQIFFDRNVKGVPVAKNLAMSMDQRDFATQLVHQITESVQVKHDGKTLSFAKLVQSRGRQLTKNDPELVTLSALRVLVITTIFGRPGLNLSDTIDTDKLPANTTPEQIERRVQQLITRLLTELYPHFVTRSAVSAPAVLAGIGIAAHQATGWATSGQPFTDADLHDLLASVRWEREARYWDGIAASANAAGTLNFGGGAKDSGGRVADALLYPDTESGRKVRGW